MASIYPIDPALAAKAYRWSQKGLRGKAVSEKLGKGITTDEANILASAGRSFAEEQKYALTDNEIALLLALAKLQRARRQKGEVSSPKAWMLCRPTGLSEGQISRMTRKRLNASHHERSGWVGLFGFLTHSTNGHIWLEPAGWALVQAIEASPSLGKQRESA